MFLGSSWEQSVQGALKYSAIKRDTVSTIYSKVTHKDGASSSPHTALAVWILKCKTSLSAPNY